MHASMSGRLTHPKSYFIFSQFLAKMSVIIYLWKWYILILSESSLTTLSVLDYPDMASLVQFCIPPVKPEALKYLSMRLLVWFLVVVVMEVPGTAQWMWMLSQGFAIWRERVEWWWPSSAARLHLLGNLSCSWCLLLDITSVNTTCSILLQGDGFTSWPYWTEQRQHEGPQRLEDGSLSLCVWEHVVHITGF